MGALGLWLCAQLALFVVTAPREARAQLSLSMRASASTSTSSSSSSSSAEASARGQALFQADLFSDTRWSEAVREEVRSEEREPNRRRPQIERSSEAAASGQAYTLGTIDQQVLQSIIMDRTRRQARGDGSRCARGPAPARAGVE